MSLPTYIIGLTFLVTRQGGEFYFSQNSFPVVSGGCSVCIFQLGFMAISGNNRQDLLQVEPIGSLMEGGRGINRLVIATVCRVSD